MGIRGVDRLPDETRPALLVSYVYLAPFMKNRARYAYRDWALDSGAFSAFQGGIEIRLQDYVDCCKRLLSEDPTLTEVFALDVIGDWRASLSNAEEMWRQGVQAIPCFHADEPWDVLVALARDYPKVALGGIALAKTGRKLAWAGQCFSRTWPKRLHGFGFGSERAVMELPFHSVDATNWEIGPCRFGQWHTFGQMSVRGSRQNLRAEVEWYLALERRARARWRREMALLDGDHPRPAAPPSARSAQQGGDAQVQRSGLVAADAAPAIRLAVDAGAASGRRADSGLTCPEDAEDR